MAKNEITTSFKDEVGVGVKCPFCFPRPGDLFTREIGPVSQSPSRQLQHVAGIQSQWLSYVLIFPSNSY